MLSHHENRESDFDVFNVGASDQTTVMQIAKIVIDELALSDVETTFEGRKDGRGWAGDVMEMLLDTTKLKEYGWNINYSSNEAVVILGWGMAQRLRP